MNTRKSKPRLRGKVQNPKPKSLQIKSLRSRARNPLQSENKQQIRTEIARLRMQRRKIIGNLEKNLQKIKNLSVSFSGLETLSENSILHIQEKRNKESLNFVNLAGDFAITGRKLSRLEKKYRKHIEK